MQRERILNLLSFKCKGGQIIVKGYTILAVESETIFRNQKSVKFAFVINPFTANDFGSKSGKT